MRQPRVVADLSKLPLHGFETASLTWWGTLAFMLIEGTGFLLTIAVYLYLVAVAPRWPIGAPPPDWRAGTATTLVLLLSLVPNVMIARAAERQDIRRVRVLLIVMAAFGTAPIPLRVLEFRSLNVLWDSNAYGSVTWFLLGLHSTHFVTDLAETFVLVAVMFTRHGENRRRFGDVQDNALYWNFVVFTWLPIYAVLYGVPRLT
ncbi:cytochrome C oxidase subunit III [Rhodopila sp.]|uniref:cytochrome C oxidase subunit III n=1 Tax=Rhodopila sp. TaxID=2480087 RepID=UPI002BBE58C1|nr:cytochrome C oxidase subunit III [Rhodopila sp.]HVZ07498.1 cytochrome C oxidase subunit III [Rhodopila sp.]